MEVDMKDKKVALILIVVCMAFTGFLLLPREDIGIKLDDIEATIRIEEEIDDKWHVVTDIYGPYYAMLFFSQDHSNHRYFIFEKVSHDRYIKVSRGRSLIELEPVDSDLYTEDVYVHTSYNDFQAWSLVFNDRIKSLQAEMPFIAISSSEYIYAFDRYKKLIEY